MNIDPKDYLSPSVDDLVDSVDKQLKLGHVILLHDAGGRRDATVQALPLLIGHLRTKGYRFATISQLVQLAVDDRARKRAEAVVPTPAADKETLRRMGQVDKRGRPTPLALASQQEWQRRLREVGAARETLFRKFQAQGWSRAKASGGKAEARATLFPPTSEAQFRIAGFDRLLFEIGSSLQLVLVWFFFIAIAFGVLRLAFTLALASAQWRRMRRYVMPEGFAPLVTVAIPAFNEGRVVCHTVESVLANDYPSLQVIVVDDGSTDDTLERLAARSERTRG